MVIESKLEHVEVVAVTARTVEAATESAITDETVGATESDRIHEIALLVDTDPALHLLRGEDVHQVTLGLLQIEDLVYHYRLKATCFRETSISLLMP